MPEFGSCSVPMIDHFGSGIIWSMKALGVVLWVIVALVAPFAVRKIMGS